MDELSPLGVFEQALARWWMVALITICGGGIGWAFHWQNPPLYEARAVFSVSIDFVQTGNLDQYEVDHAINMAGDLIGSTSVLDQVASQARAQGIQVDAQSLLANGTVERQEQNYMLRYRNTDPQKAAIVANLWAEEGLRELQTAFEHSLSANDLQQRIDELEMCLRRSVAVDPVYSGCGLQDLGQIQAEIQKENAALIPEVQASRGIIPALRFELSQKATAPTRPAVFDQNKLVLAGAFIGFLLGIWMANTRLPWLQLKVSDHA